MPSPDPASTIRPGLARGLCVGTVVLVAGMFATAVLDMPLHERLAVEDGPVEYLTFGTLLWAAGVLLGRWWRFRENQPTVWRATLLLGALAAVFGAGEEISWGQRLFGWETTEAFGANRQGETNVHNLEIAGLNLNRVVFTFGLGAALGLYFLVLPVLARRSRAVGAWLTRFGVPVGGYRTAAWFIGGAAATALIPSLDRWEVLEVLVPVGALVVLFERGVVGGGLGQSAPPTFRP